MAVDSFQDKPWVPVLRHKYIENICLVRALEYLRAGFTVKIGEGSSSFFFDDWLVMGPISNMVLFAHISNT